MRRTRIEKMNMGCMEKGMRMCCCGMSCFDAYKLNHGRIKESERYRRLSGS